MSTERIIDNGDVRLRVEVTGEGPAILCVHGWGAPIASHTAIRHPDRVRAVANMSVPHLPPSADDLVATFDLLWADRFFYILRFQEPGAMLPAGPRDAAYLSLLPEPPADGLGFMSDDDLDVYVSTFRRTGMVGAFNRYRAMRLDGAADADIVGLCSRWPRRTAPGTLVSCPPCPSAPSITSW